MSAINLEKSIKKLKKCYTGKDENGVHVLDKSKLGDSLAFDFAMARVVMAIQNKELNEEDFISELEE